jgi:uncharacterized protein YrzB (UPF0473 family)
MTSYILEFNTTIFEKNAELASQKEKSLQQIEALSVQWAQEREGLKGELAQTQETLAENKKLTEVLSKERDDLKIKCTF